MVSFNRRIVRILEETGAVDMQVLAQASQIASKGEKSVAEFLLQQNVFDEGALLGVLADRLGFPPVDLSRLDIPSDMTEVVPQELDWKELVRAYPIPAVLAVAAGGFYLGAIHGRRIVETLGDLVTQRVEDTAERLHGAARRRGR